MMEGYPLDDEGRLEPISFEALEARLRLQWRFDFPPNCRCVVFGAPTREMIAEFIGQARAFEELLTPADPYMAFTLWEIRQLEE